MKQKWKKLPKWLKRFIVVISLIFITEIVLRFFIGLGDLAVYREDSDYEYFYEANQDVWRFGNHIVTNEYGMRSKPVNKKKKIKILEFGDSVLNGGAHIDQDNLATSMDEIYLNEKFNNEVQIFNISAQSWGVSNAFSFLKKHGNFDAQIIVLVFSSHDLNDNMHFKKVVGNHPAWPNAKPLLAITDAWTRFVWPKILYWTTGKGDYDYLNDFDDKKVNTGWAHFFEYGKKHNIPVIVYLHASKKEVLAGNYNKKGQKIISICNDNQIPVFTDISSLSDSESFIDDIHLNANGHQIMSNILQPKLEKLILTHAYQ